jgi:LacI family transcriptional regulator
MAVTQRQIAQKLKISRSLVGHALSGRTEVAAATRELILATAREMGYDPDANTAARLMNARRHNKPVKTGTIALMFHFLGASPRALPFYTPVLEGVEAATAELDSSLCLCLIRIAELPRLIRERNVDGVIVIGDFPELAAEIKSLGIPIVTFHMEFEGISSVFADDFEGARQATRHLIELGHRDIGYIGVHGGLGAVEEIADDDDATTLMDLNNPRLWRYLGYRAAMKESSLPLHDEWIVRHFCIPQPTANNYCDKLGHCNLCAACCAWAELVEKSQNSGSLTGLPTALVCHNDLVAMGIAENAARDGLLVPQDLSLVGFDNNSLDYHSQPAITSMALPLYEMGRRAVLMLDELGQKQDMGESEPLRSILPTALVMRESTRDLTIAIPV